MLGHHATPEVSTPPEPTSAVAKAVVFGRALGADGLVVEDALREVEGELIAAERWAELRELYLFAAKRAPTGELGRYLTLSAALLSLDKLDDPGEAERLARRVLASDPEDVGALDASARALTALGRAADAADQWELAIACAADEDKVGLCLDLAELAATRLGQPDRAVDALMFALRLEPARLELLGRAREIFLAEARLSEAKTMLDAEHRARFGEAPVVEPSDASRALGEVYGQLGLRLLEAPLEHRAAEDALLAARALGWSDALRHLDALADLRERWEARAKALVAEAEGARNKNRAAELYVQVAELHRAFGKDPIRSDQYLARSLILVPGHLRAVEFLERAYGDRRAELARRLLDLAAGLREPGAVGQVHRRLLRLASLERTREPDAVVAWLGRLLQQDPAHREATRLLSTLLSRAGRTDEQAAALKSFLAATTDPAAKLACHLELGRVYAEVLGDSEQAKLHFEAARRLEPDHFLAASALRALYTDLGDRAGLLSVLTVLVECAPDVFSRFDLLTEQARTAAGVSDEHEFAAALEIAELDPNAVEARERARVLGPQVGRADRVAALFERTAAAAPAGARVDLLARAAELYEAAGGHADEAIRLCRAALAEAPGHLAVEATLERLLRERNDPKALVSLLEEQAATVTDARTKGALLLRLAAVLDHDLEDPERASAVLEQVLGLDPDNLAALSYLAILLERQGRYEPLVETLARAEKLIADPRARVLVLAQRAAALVRLDRAREAADAYLAALALAPADEELVAALSELADRVGDPRVARALAPIFERRDDRVREVEMLRIELSHTADAATKNRIARRAAERLHPILPEGSLELLALALAADPRDQASLDAVVRLAVDEGLAKPAVHALGPMVDKISDRVARARIHAALGQIAEQALDDRELAVRSFERALADDGGNGAALESLERLSIAAGRAAELAAFLGDRIGDAGDSAARARLGVRLGALREERLGDLEGAVAAYRRVLEIDPGEPEALARIIELFDRLDRPADMIAAIDRMRSDDPERTAALDVRSGRILATRLGEPKKALARYERALGRSPGHEAALAGIEALLAVPEVAKAAADAALPALRAGSAPARLARALEVKLAGTTEPAERRRLALELAEVEADRLERPEAAFRALLSALPALAAEDRPRLVRLGLKANQGPELVAALERAHAATPGDLDLLVTLGRLYDGPMASAADAIRIYEEIVARSPQDREALEALERLHSTGADAKAFADVLVKRAEAAGEAEAKIGFLRRAAGIYEEAENDLATAARVLELAHAVDPFDRVVIGDLVRLSERLGRRDRALELLGREAAAVDDKAERVAVLERLAAMAVEAENPAARVDALVRTLEAEPLHRGAAEALEGYADDPVYGRKAALALEAAYRRRADFGRLVAVYERLAETAEDPAERLERLLAIRALYEDRLEKPERAFQAVSRALKEAPEDPRVRATIERLAAQIGAEDELFGLVEDLVEGHAPGDELRVRLRRWFAELAERTRKLRKRAIAAWRGVLAERPGDLDALDALVRLGTEFGETATVIGALVTASEVLESVDAKIQHLRAAARLSEGAGEDGRFQAMDLYERVLGLSRFDPIALARLEVLYTDEGSYTDVARILERMLESDDAERDRDAILLRLARLRADRLSAPEAGARALLEVLDRAASSTSTDAAIDALVELLGRLEAGLAAELAARIEPRLVERRAHASVLTARRARLAAERDPGARRELFLSIARTYERDLRDPKGAFATVTEAYFETPGDEGLEADLERLGRGARAEAELAEALEAVLERLTDPDGAVRVRRKLAALYADRLGQPPAAIRHYEALLEVNPTDEAAILALEKIHRASGQPRGLIAALRMRLMLPATTKAEKMEIAQEIAKVLDGALQDPEAAIEAHWARLEIEPTDVAALDAILGLAEREERFDQLVKALERRIKLTEAPSQAAAFLLRLGRVRLEAQLDPIGAVEALGLALARVPGHPEAVRQLVAIAHQPGPGRPVAARALVPVYLASGAYAEVIEALSAALEGEPRASERQALLLQIADIEERTLGRLEPAFEHARRALAEDFTSAEARDRVERLARELGAASTLAEFYAAHLEAAGAAGLGLELRRRLGELFEREIGDPQQAIRHYLSVLDLAPGDAKTLEALERLYAATGSFGELADIYRRRIARTEDAGDRVALLLELGRVQAEHQGDAPGAIATLRRLLELEPDHRVALARLGALAERLGRASDGVEAYERLIRAELAAGLTPIDSRRALLALSFKLRDHERGLELARDILAVDPFHEATLAFLNEQLAEALAEEAPSLARGVVDVLVEGHRRARAHAPLIEALRIRLQVGDPAGRAADRLEIAEAYEVGLRRPELAFAALTELLREAPTDEAGQAHLVRLAGPLGLTEELLDAFEEALPRIASAQDRIPLLLRIGELAEEALGDKARAAAAYERVLADRPLHAEALALLDRLYVSIGRHGALADVLEKRVEIAEAPRERHELLMRLTALWESELGELAEAKATARRARREDPDDPETLRALVRLLDEAEDRDELVQVLERAVEVVEEPWEVTELRLRLGRLYAARGEADKACDLLERVHAESGGSNVEVRRALEDLYEETGRYAELAAHLEAQLERTRDEAEALRLRRRLGLVKGVRLGQVEAAVESWNEILKRNPTDVEALEALRKIYRAAKKAEELVAVLRKLIPLQKSPAGVKDIRFELAETYLFALGRRPEAVEAARRALDVEPHQVAELLRLEEILLEAEAYTDLVKVMNLRAEITDDPGLRADVYFQVAQLFEEKMGRRAGAATAYERIFEAEPGNARAFDALARLYEAAGDYKKLVRALGLRLEAIDDHEERTRLLLRQIDIQERRLAHKDLAFTAACRAFAESRGDPEVQATAERLAADTESFEILAEIYEEQVGELPLDRASALRRRLAELYLDVLDEPARAERHLDILLTQRHDDIPARRLLLRLLEAGDRVDEIAIQKLDLVDVLEDPTEKRDELLELAALEETRRRDDERAIEMVRRALDVAPGDLGALRELARLYRKTDAFVPLTETLRRLAAVVDTPLERADLLFEVAYVFEKSVGSPEDALAAYRDVLDTEPGHPEALRAAEALYSADARWRELVELYEAQVARLGEHKDAAVRTLFKMVEVAEDRLEDLELAEGAARRILELEPASVPAFERLERALERAERFPELVEVYRRHLEIADGPAAQVDVLLLLADLASGRAGDLELADASYRQAISLDPRCIEALDGLAKVEEARGRLEEARDALERVVAILGRAPASVPFRHRVAELWARLSDEASAELGHREVLAIDPSHVPSIAALTAIEAARGNDDAVGALYVQEAEATGDAARKAELFVRAAEIELDKKNDAARAAELLDRALAAEPDRIDAIRTAAELAFGAEDWPKAQDLLRRLVRGDFDLATDERCRAHYRLGYIAEKLGDDRLALEEYERSFAIDPSYLPTLEGLGAALVRAERWRDAQRVFSSILSYHRDSLTDAEVVDLHFQLGELASRLVDKDRARRSFENALDLDPRHAPTLRAYARLAEDLKQHERAYELRSRLIGLLSGEPLFEELMLQAALSIGPLKDKYRAIDALALAQSLRPDDRRVLSDLAALYVETGQQPRAIEALKSLRRVAESAAEKRDLSLRLAKLYEESQGDVKRAIEALNAALDADPSHMEAFQSIERLLAKEKRWGDLELNYRLMLQRLPKDQSYANHRVVLWTTLGDLYLYKLKNEEAAKTAYEVVLKMKPDEHGVATKLAKMLAQNKDTWRQASRLYLSISEATGRHEPLKAAWPLLFEIGDHDLCLLTVGALGLLGRADDEDKQMYSGLLKRAGKAPARPLSEELWRDRLLHPYCRSSIADILKTVYRGAPVLFEAGQRGLQLKKKEKVELGEVGRSSRSQLLFFNVWRTVTQILRGDDVEHFHRAGTTAAPRFYPGQVGVLFAGTEHAIFGMTNEREVAWWIARQMTVARPEFAPCAALLPVEIAALVEAAVTLVDPRGTGVNLGVDARLVQDWQRALKRALSERALESLKEPVVRCQKKHDMRRLPKFLEGVEHTANRAALLFAGDVRVAERGLGSADLIVEVPEKVRSEELRRFLISEDHLILREKTGLVVKLAGA